ncbi:hypothetical protein QFC21_001215 [Naganishia friedmannii]|uniref:Uncharacterized protein n=1 Tax=Naganishia friedmannii TaxID=89922 RepID=A0ACC2W5G2_9TREE|nr:hypothetical protein QFC21_001215 [Naganishia friedmannii]
MASAQTPATSAPLPPPSLPKITGTVSKGKQREKPIASLLAGATAGAIEGFVTYPTEFAKTQLQFAGRNLAPGSAAVKPVGPIGIIRDTIANKGIRGLYAGCSALVIGNAVKAGVRFLSYDQYKSMLVDSDLKPRLSHLELSLTRHHLFAQLIQGKLSAPRSLVAGLGAGMTEAVFAVTPSETIKTKLIEDSRRSQPRYRGLIHGSSQIIRDEGLGGIYRGLLPVNWELITVFSVSAKMMRQGANSAVRFTTYSAMKQAVQGSAGPSQQLPSTVTFGIGAMAGIITVYSTMPLDVIKTRMQSLEARSQYRNSAHCAYRIFTEEGVTKFWKGTTPRLARLIMSGGIVFTVYEAVYPVMAGLV